jgi:hypothetical protein
MKGAFTPTGATLLVTAICLMAVADLESQQAQTTRSPCDAKLIPPKGDPLAYGRRGDRCEGLYVLEVSGSAHLSLVAFNESVAGTPTTLEERVRVQWMGTPGRLPVHLRAVSLRRPIYYRMDAVRPEEADGYEWPTADVVARLNLGRADVGIVGWVEQAIANRNTRVYLPLRVGNSSGPATGQYVARVVPGVGLSKVFVTLTLLADNGGVQEYLKRDEPLDEEFFPADRPIKVTISPLSNAGLYRITLGAVFMSGGSSTMTFVFFHPGSPT